MRGVSGTKKLAFLVCLMIILGFFALNSTLADKNSEKVREVFDETKTINEKFTIFRIASNDSYEPDNNNTLANWTYSNGTPQTHSFDPQGDVDYVKFNATENTSYIIWTTTITNTSTDTYLRLRSTDGTSLLGYNDDGGFEVGGNASTLDSEIIWYCPLDGTYYAEISDRWEESDGSHEYNITINTTNLLGHTQDQYEIDNNYTLATWINATNSSSPKEIQNHSFAPYTNDEDYVKFNATNNTWYVIETINTTQDTDSRLYLFDTDGTTLLNTPADTDDLGYPFNNNSLIFWNATATDTFYVKNFDFWTKGGNYSISVYEPNFSEILTNGTPVSIDLDYQNSTFYFNFSAVNGTEYYIRTDNLSTKTDPRLRLFHTNGSLLATGDDLTYPTNNNSRIVWKCEENGTYYIVASIIIDSDFNVTIDELGYLETYWLNPTNVKNVTQYGTFEILTGVRCVGGFCGNITATLDPEKTRDQTVSKTLVEETKNVKQRYVIEEPKEKSVSEEATIKGSEEIYIVTLKDNNLPIYSIQNVENVKSRIQQNQDRFIESVDDIKIKRKMSTMNMIVIEATPAQAGELSNNPLVESVSPRIEYNLILDESVPQINANDTWYRLDEDGLNLTGQGQTVCIIDSGINYTHINLNSSYLGGYDFCGATSLCTSEDSDPMDDNGHGTHVSGIIASNDTTYRGVAPNAGIIMIKACNATGTCYSDDIVSGIDWCRHNASTYNISVISISIGGGSYSSVSACESYIGNIPTKNAINSATAAGLTVVIASGNNGNSTHIAAPACIGNAISVGAVSKADEVASYSQSGTLLDLLAPGTLITSTSLRTGTSCSSGGDFSSCSGTSMATPHVAAAIAVMNQYYNSRYGVNLNKTQALDILNGTGVKINDTRNNLNFSRIDLLAAVIELGDKGTIPMGSGEPFFTTDQNPIYPANLSCLNNMDEGDSCNMTWTVNATGILNTTWEFFTTFEASDSLISNETSKINITITNQNMYPQIIFNSPLNGTDQNINTTINVTIYSNNSLITSANVRFENSTYNHTWVSLSENDSINNIWFNNYNASGLLEGEYSVRISANNSAGSNNQSIVNITLDANSPQLQITSTYPQNISNPWFNFTATDLNLNTTWLYVDDENFTIIDGNVTLNLTYPGLYTVNLFANDSFGNQNNTRLTLKEHFAMNVSNWTNRTISELPEVTDITIFNSTTDITNDESTYVNTTLNITFITPNFNTTIYGFNGEDVFWGYNSSLYNFTETNTYLEQKMLDLGKNASMYIYADDLTSTFFNSTTKYNATVEFGFNSTGFTDLYYCEDEYIVDTNITCSEISACSGNFTGTECYNESNSKTKVYVPHLSSVVVINDTIAPQITINSPINYSYTDNINATNLIANITVSPDTTSCKYSLLGGTNTTMTKSGTTFTAGMGSPLYNKFYNITFYCNDSYGNPNSTITYFTMDDDTVPSLSITSETAAETTADIETDSNEKLFGVLFYSKTPSHITSVSDTNCRTWTNHTDANDIEDDWEDETGGWPDDANCDVGNTCFYERLGHNGLFYTDPTFELTNLDSGTKYYYGLCLCDKNGNCGAYRTYDVTTDEKDDGSDGGSTGGEAATDDDQNVVATSKTIGIWSLISANEEIEWDLFSSIIPIDKVYFKVDSAKEAVTIELASFGGTEKPQGLPTPPDNTHSYIKITTAIYNDVYGVKMPFSIPASWFTTNNYDPDKVKVYRYVGDEWVALYTRTVSTSGSEYSYEFESPGFSYFALTAPDAPPQPVTTSTTTLTPEIPTTTSSNLTAGCGDGNCSVNESCKICPGDCGECEPLTKLEWNDNYYYYVSAAIIIGAIIFSLYYRVIVKGMPLPGINFEQKRESTYLEKRAKEIKKTTRQTQLRSKKLKKEEKKQPPKKPGKPMLPKINIFSKQKKSLNPSKKPDVFRLE